jgi:hypothetical protein
MGPGPVSVAWGTWVTRLEEVVLQSKSSRRGPGRHAQLAVDGCQMGIDSAWTDDKLLGHFSIRQAPRDEA